jgi:hypothetical protein
MLEFDVVLAESYDETTEKFVQNCHRVRLEHSLASMSKWESIWEEPFLSPQERSDDKTVSYIKEMVVGAELPPAVFLKVVSEHLEAINTYVGAKMTATKIYESKTGGSREVITAELIYYWMISMNIPFECQHWHLNRLITLIRVINAKNSPKKKMSPAERRQLNRQRIAKNNGRG